MEVFMNDAWLVKGLILLGAVFFIGENILLYHMVCLKRESIRLVFTKNRCLKKIVKQYEKKKLLGEAVSESSEWIKIALDHRKLFFLSVTWWKRMGRIGSNIEFLLAFAMGVMGYLFDIEVLMPMLIGMVIGAFLKGYDDLCQIDKREERIRRQIADSLFLNIKVPPLKSMKEVAFTYNESNEERGVKPMCERSNQKEEAAKEKMESTSDYTDEERALVEEFMNRYMNRKDDGGIL